MNMRIWLKTTIMGLSLVVSLFALSCQASNKSIHPPIVPVTGGAISTEAAPGTTERLPMSLYLPLIKNGSAYYVATTGNDSNSGTADHPWRTLSKGVNSLRPGDTLYIKSGTYIQTAPLEINASGDGSNRPITISTAPNESSMAVITGDTDRDGIAETPSRSVYDGLVELKGNYIHFKNIEVTNSKGRGISSGGSHNIISNNNVHHTWNSGIYIYAADNLIEGNKVWRAADSNYCNGAIGRQCNGNWAGGIAWGASHDAVPPGLAPRTVIRNNSIFHTSGEGLLCMHTDYGLVEGNIIYDNWALNVDLDQCSYTTLQKNLVYATSDKVWWRGSGRPSAGIMLSNEGIKDSDGNMYPIGHDRKVINNILVGNGTNFYFWAGDGTGSGLATSALKSDLIAYNTLVNTGGAGGAGIKIDAGPHENTRITNNLIYEQNNSLALVDSTNGITFGNNLWSDNPPASVSSSTDIIGNPFLVDPNHVRVAGAVLPEWYQINTSSPAIGHGFSLAEVTVDFWNTLRTLKPDIGADEVTP